ncbi:porin [Caldimonas tepidiphila]|uniref:porin n=1 Tax=Caldimonas tepidiphila TaxID=2315841 RepID=UPI000E5AB396|nr:porin [Caldimonas tepidiphila]
MQQARLSTLVALALASLSGASQAVSFSQGGATLDINGTVNGFYSHRTTEDGNGGNKTTTSSLTNGLLPGWINFVFTTKVEGLDVKAHFGFAPGIMNDSSIVGLPDGSGGRAYTQIDTRNLYFQFGNADAGTLKIGRDIGLFGQKIVLSDMTLLGVGGTTNAALPFNTTFGMIGHGYMYTGFQPQITYSTSLAGLQLAAGIFQPSRYIANAETSTPGVQALASFDWKGALPGSVWAGAIHQSLDGGPGNVATFSARGAELGAKLGLGGLELTAYGFDGKGLGMSTVGALFNSPNGETDSRGALVQATYKLGDTKFGVNVGENRDSGGRLTTGTVRNRSATVGVYHTLNKHITLVGEHNQERFSTGGTETGKTSTISLGGILFF